MARGKHQSETYRVNLEAARQDDPRTPEQILKDIDAECNPDQDLPMPEYYETTCELFIDGIYSKRKQA